MKAYAYRSGVIGFDRNVPEIAIEIAEGTPKELRNTIGLLARHGYEKGVLLVPGIPEAETDAEAGDALERFIRFVRRDLGRCKMTPAEFNERYPEGTRVLYFETFWDEKHLETLTLSEAFLDAAGKPVIQLQGKRGYVALDHCVVEKEEISHAG